MKLITAIHIRGFRSLRNESIDDLGRLTSLVGRNSSGKSNVLRALNLFFNEEIEFGRPVSFARDLHFRPKAKRKKEIQIAVTFGLPSNFRFRKSLQGLRDSIGSSFTITKTWTLDAREAMSGDTTLSIDGTRVKNGPELARQFLQLVQYRYIPNRTVPAALLREESREIAAAIFAKMQSESGAQELLAALNVAASVLLKRARGAMSETDTPLTNPALASPQTLAEMLSVAGFQATGSLGNQIRDEEWGAGNQAFFLYQVLQAVDTNYSRSFGWRQAAIWGVEEPESGLHRDLESKLAAEFDAWTSDDQLKLQIIQTTHAPVFVMASDVGYWIEFGQAGTEVQTTSVATLVRDAETRGVTAWTHPILSFPFNPVVLVEGEIDSRILTHVASLAGLSNIRFVSLRGLDDGETGDGKDSIIAYLRRHASLLTNRPNHSPLLVQFDWDISNDELNRARGFYGVSGATGVARMNDGHCDPLLGKDFRGIERFYPVSVIKASAAANEIAIGEPVGRPISISSSELNAGKLRLMNRALALTELAEFGVLRAVLTDLEAAISNLSRREDAD
jgi:hypothetical protein